jgi:hypothetical protein
MACWHLGLRAIRTKILHEKEKVDASNFRFLGVSISLGSPLLPVAHHLGLTLYA